MYATSSQNTRAIASPRRPWVATVERCRYTGEVIVTLAGDWVFSDCMGNKKTFPSAIQATRRTTRAYVVRLSLMYAYARYSDGALYVRAASSLEWIRLCRFSNAESAAAYARDVFKLELTNNA